MSTTDILLRTIPGERFTPYTLARKLNARVLLESASFHRGRERYSILLLKLAFTIQERDGQITMTRDGRRFRLSSSGRDILDVLRYFADQHAEAAHSAAPEDAGAYVSRTSRLPVVRAHPFPFPVGGIGYLSYEYAARFDTVRVQQKADSLDLPDAYFVFGHVFVVFDHYTDSLTLVGVNYREHRIDLQQALDETERRIDDLDFNFMAATKSRPDATVCGSGDEQWYLDGWSSCAARLSRATCSRRCCRGGWRSTRRCRRWKRTAACARRTRRRTCSTSTTAISSCSGRRRRCT